MFIEVYNILNFLKTQATAEKCGTPQPDQAKPWGL